MMWGGDPCGRPGAFSIDRRPHDGDDQQRGSDPCGRPRGINLSWKPGTEPDVDGLGLRLMPIEGPSQSPCVFLSPTRLTQPTDDMARRSFP